MRPTVAIIDADATACQALRALLGTLDVEVSTYDSAENFVARDPSVQTPQCVIVDLNLPGMSGLELLRQLRAADADLPIILLATEPDVATAVAAMRQGATDFIEKPQMDVKLMRRMTQLLRNGAHAGTM